MQTMRNKFNWRREKELNVITNGLGSADRAPSDIQIRNLSRILEQEPVTKWHVVTSEDMTSDMLWRQKTWQVTTCCDVRRHDKWQHVVTQKTRQVTTCCDARRHDKWQHVVTPEDMTSDNMLWCQKPWQVTTCCDVRRHDKWQHDVTSEAMRSDMLWRQ
jgi:hypothetical protein